MEIGGGANSEARVVVGSSDMINAKREKRDKIIFLEVILLKNLSLDSIVP